MSSHHGDEAKDEAAEEIEHHVEILLILHIIRKTIWYEKRKTKRYLFLNVN